MMKQLKVPAGFKERWDILSSVLKKAGKPDHGVIYTSSDAPSISDFNVDVLVGCSIENTKAPPDDPHRYFEILGGYFCEDTASGTSTKKVFGIAKSPDFGVSEGGTTTVQTNWELDDPMAEAGTTRDEGGRGSGWTFIVKSAPREKFPHSSDPLGLVVDCPEASAVGVQIGKCEEQPGGGQKRRVTLKATVGGGPTNKWTWEFGDGQNKSGQGQPPAEITHHYASKPASAPKLLLTGHPACGDPVTATADLQAFKAFQPCQPKVTCPEITKITDVCQAQNAESATYTFTATVKGEAPESFEWDWGDGTARATSTGPASPEHKFKKPKSGEKEYTVSVKSRGPGDCTDAAKKTIRLVAKPPVTWMCQLYELLVAFLLSLAFGCFVVMLAAGVAGSQEGDIATVAFIIFLVLGLLSLFFWRSRIKKTACPAATKCDWFCIGWTFLLAGFLMAVFVHHCCPDASWWAAILLPLALGLLLLVMWIKSCGFNAKTFILHLIAGILAYIIVSYVIAERVLAGCL